MDDSFEYRLRAEDGAPLPDEASGEFYRFELKGDVSGDIKLNFPFTKPGRYYYLVRAYIPDRKTDYSYDEKTYKLMIMMINTDNGLGVGAMTVQDETLAKYPELPFRMAYTKEPPAQPGDNDDPGGAPGDGRGGGNAAQGAGGTDGNVTPPEPPTPIDDPEPPKGIIPDPEDWALLNLLLMIITVMAGLMDGLLYFRNPRDKYGEEYEDEDEIKRHGLPRIMAMITAVISVILFFLTEDMTDPMIWVDEYTVWMLILFIATVILTMLSKKEYEEEEELEQGAT